LRMCEMLSVTGVWGCVI